MPFFIVSKAEDEEIEEEQQQTLNSGEHSLRSMRSDPFRTQNPQSSKTKRSRVSKDKKMAFSPKPPPPQQLSVRDLIPPDLTLAIIERHETRDEAEIGVSLFHQYRNVLRRIINQFGKLR